MKRVALCNLVIFLCVTAGVVCGQQREPVWPAITGIVVDENDTPVRRAEVCASFNGPWVGPEPCDVSNARGEFSIHVWRSGTYTVWAEQLERGYPDSKSNFYGPGWQTLPQVTIDETSKLEPLRIKFARKAGRLVLTILDGTTNKPIERGTVILSRDQPNSWSSDSAGWPKGHYEILTPDGPFTIKFQTWQGKAVDRKAFDKSGVQIETLQLDLGARREMTIRLN